MYEYAFEFIIMLYYSIILNGINDDIRRSSYNNFYEQTLILPWSFKELMNSLNGKYIN